MRNEISWFDKDENSSGQVSARLSADATTVKGAIGDRISLVAQNATLLITACIISFTLQWKLAFVILATFPLLIFASMAEVINLNSQLALIAASGVETIFAGVFLQELLNQTV